MEAIGALQPRAFQSVPKPLTRCKTIKIASFDLCRKRALGSSVFLDKGHLNYYSSSRSEAIRCRDTVCGDGKMEKKKKKDREVKDVKKRIKVLKGLSRDLNMFADSGFWLNSGTDDLSVDHQVEANRISDAMMLLQGQMEQLRLKEKELKLISKEEKQRLRTAKMQNLDCGMLSSSSSSSSESSDSECDRESSDVLLLSNSDRLDGAATLLLGQLQDLRNREKEMKAIKGVAATPLQVTLPQVETVFRSNEESNGGKDIEIGSTRCLEQDCCSQITNNLRQIEGAESWGGKKSLVDESTKRIEVCMGGKCKKAGAGLLLEEFQRVVGIEGAVFGCKCMGKCRDGPNVRVFGSTSQVHGYPRTAANSLCLGVGIEDVSLIVDNLLNESAPALPSAL